VKKGISFTQRRKVYAKAPGRTLAPFASLRKLCAFA
jgi:hypothetical protein